MNHKKSMFATSLAALAAAVAFSTPVAAAPTTSEAPYVTGMQGPQGHHHRERHHQGQRRQGHHDMHAALVVPAYGGVSQQFLDGLSLTEAQKVLLAQAQQASQSMWSEHRAEMQTQRDARKTQLAQGKIDPRAQLEARQAQHAKMLQAQADMNARWLAVWDALDNAQREKIASYLAGRSDSTSRR